MQVVLVVDDSAVDRRIAGGLLEKVPEFEVAYAVDGEDALDRIKQSPPAVVVTDLRMPGIDGLELVATVRRDFPLVPVVIMTSDGSEELAVEALKSGAASYTPKSHLADDLVDTVQHVLTAARKERGEARLIECTTHATITLKIENDSSLIGPLVGLLNRRIAEPTLEEEADRVRINVALEEALANAIYHGNLEISSKLREDDDRAYYQLAKDRAQLEPYRDRRVFITGERTREQIKFIIRDEGPGFDPHALPDPTAPENLDRAYGRGLLLIRTFMDTVDYNERGNEITMIKRRNSASNGDS